MSHVSPLPKSPSIALSDPNWRIAMYDEYNALVKNNTWILVPKPPNANVVRSMWLFRHKYHADGSLSRYKARLVAIGRTQQLHRSLYGLKQAPRAWFQQLASYDLRVGFSSSRCDSSFFIYRDGTEVAYLLIFVDDIVLTASSTKFTSIKCFGAIGQGSYGGLHLVIVFFRRYLLSWSAKRQHTLSRSSAEDEYRGVTNVVAETAWLHNLLIYCENVSAIYMTTNPVQHQRTKHIKIDIYFVRDMVARGHVRVFHVPSRYQYADILTKGLPSALFEEFHTSLIVRSPLAQTTGEC
ncbi:ribonuclease H-like domain-containing protein [Tanacetum coccineum]